MALFQTTPRTGFSFGTFAPDLRLFSARCPVESRSVRDLCALTDAEPSRLKRSRARAHETAETV